MKSFILTFAMVSCFLLSQSVSVVQSRGVMTTSSSPSSTTTTTDETLTTSTSETSSSAAEVLHPFAKAAVASAGTATRNNTSWNKPSTTTKAPLIPGQQCKAIGSSCSVSDECCSRRCTSYRQRCVY